MKSYNLFGAMFKYYLFVIFYSFLLLAEKKINKQTNKKQGATWPVVRATCEQEPVTAGTPGEA